MDMVVPSPWLQQIYCWKKLSAKHLDEVKALTKENVLELLGIELGPVRLKCALLSLKVLKGGVYGLGGEELQLDEDS